MKQLIDSKRAANRMRRMAPSIRGREYLRTMPTRPTFSPIRQANPRGGGGGGGRGGGRGGSGRAGFGGYGGRGGWGSWGGAYGWPYAYGYNPWSYSYGYGWPARAAVAMPYVPRASYTVVPWTGYSPFGYRAGVMA